MSHFILRGVVFVSLVAELMGQMRKASATRAIFLVRSAAETTMTL